MKNADRERMLEYAVKPHLELVGNTCCYIEGLEAIEELSAETIRLCLGSLSAVFSGDCLTISSFSGAGAAVEGTILAVEFVSHA